MRNVPDLHNIESEVNFPEITSSYDFEKDAWNWRCAMNAFTNGRGYETMSEEDQNILAQIKGLSLEDANKILLPYLDKKYQNNHKEIDDAANQIKMKLDIQKNQIFELMEKLTKRPIFNERFQIRYTTCIRGPYNRKTGEIWTGYPQHQEFRKILEDYRLSCGDKKDFEDLINFGCEYILQKKIFA